MRNALTHVSTTIGLAAALAALVGSLSPSTSEAQDRRAIVLDFSGPGADAARTEVVRSLEGGGWDVASPSEVQRAATRLGADPASPEVAGEIGARAIVEGRVTRRGRRFQLRVTVSDASSGAQLAEETFSGRGAGRLRAQVRSQLFDRIGFSMSQGNAPGRAASGGSSSRASSRDMSDIEDEAPPALSRRGADDDDDGEDAEESSSSRGDASGPQLSPLWVAIGASGFSRDYSYNDDIFLTLRPYQLPIGWTLRAQARWYPAAHFTQDFLANLGVELYLGGAIGIQSRQRDGTTYPTDSIDIRGGADLRIPLAPLELGIGVGGGIHTFALGASSGGNTAALPNVEYQFLRPAVRARLDVGAGIYTEASFGWRVLTGTGALGTWFPRNSGTGMDLGAHLGWESDIGVGVRAGFEMARYWFSMNPEPGDTYIAGGAADQYLSGSVDLVWRMR
ncbi:hypothetical protein [Sandaracinus amylolyticus]|nr:hypothetical protein [Sandaracinus amylolyticus]